MAGNTRWSQSSSGSSWGIISCCTLICISLIFVTIVGLSVFVITHDDYKEIFSNSETIKTLSSNFALPDFQDVQSHLNFQAISGIWITLHDALNKGWEYICHTMNQFSVSAKETCTNIMKFINTIVAEWKSADVFKRPMSPFHEGVNSPNDDSEDYTPELNEWIRSQETQNEELVKNKDEDVQLGDLGASQKQADYLADHDTLNQGNKDSINSDILVDGDQMETEVEPSFVADYSGPTIKVSATSGPTAQDRILVDEPIITKTTIHTLGLL